MRAIVCHAPEDLRIDTQEVEKPGPGQLQVRVIDPLQVRVSLVHRGASR